MSEARIFGPCLEGVQYTDRPAAYAVIAGEDGMIATVKGTSDMSFLPGGGSLPGETAEETVVREVREELARSVRLVRIIGIATQYFYSGDDDCHYKMSAVFFLAEFCDDATGMGEHDLFWLPLAEAEKAFFHQSHAWAVRQRVRYSPPFGIEPHVRPVCKADNAEWLRMRRMLWPEAENDHAAEVAAFFATDSFRWSESLLVFAVFVAVRPAGGLCGFLEASVRPYVDGCETRPVGYVEGWFVDADMRRQGIGKKLVTASERWAATQGCQEMASDAHLENTVSHKSHKALGFEESSRLVHFRKRLTGVNEKAIERFGTIRQLTLSVQEGTFAVCRLAPDAPTPPWATAGPFVSVTRTADELSVVCPQEAVPDEVQCERGWRCLRVAGTLPFTAVGVLASLTAPVAAAGIGLFAVSTYDTDYLLLKQEEWAAAVDALRRAGHVVK